MLLCQSSFQHCSLVMQGTSLYTGNPKCQMQVHDHWAQYGVGLQMSRLMVCVCCRVIALAYKQLDSSISASDLRTMPRGTVEQGLCFGGFAVLRCPLKAESEPALKMLKDSSHQLVMITGDAPLTACYTAGQVHIVDRPVLLLVHRSGTAHCMGRMSSIC